eukprot:Hpha_TRINITY_DN34989_c0_g1::TRINITY_DN34989_c0_g1_i1::g.184125::m.184125
MLTGWPALKHSLAVGDEVRASGLLVHQKLNGLTGIVVGHRDGRVLVDFDVQGRHILDPRHLQVVSAFKDQPKSDLTTLLAAQRKELKGREEEFSMYRESTFQAERPWAPEPPMRRGDSGEMRPFIDGCVFADLEAREGGITEQDVLQKRIQDSALLAVLSALTVTVRGREYLRSIVRVHTPKVVNAGGPVCEVRFLRTKEEARKRGDQQLAEWVPISAVLPCHASRKKSGEMVPLYAKSKSRDPKGRRVLWPSLVEKAWVVYQRSLYPSHYDSGSYGFTDAERAQGNNDAAQTLGDGVHSVAAALQSLTGWRGDLYKKERGRIPLDWDVLVRAAAKEGTIIIAQFGLHAVPVVLVYKAQKLQVVRVRDQAAPEESRFSEYELEGFLQNFDSVRIAHVPTLGEILTEDIISPHGSPRRAVEEAEEGT